MKVLALYLPEETGGKKEIAVDDLIICFSAAEAGHDVVVKPYHARTLEQAKDFDVVLNLCDGFEQDNNFVEIRIAKHLEKHKLKFTGNHSETFKLCNNKAKTKKLLEQKNIPTPPFAVLSKVPKTLPDNLSFPVIVKPVKTDAAIGIHSDSVAYNIEQLKKNVKRVLKKHEQSALVEKYLEGPEYCVPVIGNKKPKALWPVRIKYRKKYYSASPKILSYAAKWEKGKEFWGLRSRPSKKPMPKVQRLAEKTYKALGIRGYGTVDVRADLEGNLYVLEANPNCWIGPGSDTAKSAKAMGLTHPKLINKILLLAKSS